MSTFGTGRCPGRINFDVASGQVIEISSGPTRNKEDALAHLQHLISSDPHATKWHLVLDTLNIHQTESLVHWIAQREGIDQDTLGVKGKRGILRSSGVPSGVLA